nr:hypothetical protein [Morchella crassipes]
MGTPPPSASMWLAHEMHPSLSEMDALPPSPSPPRAVVGGCKGGGGLGGVLAATQLLRSWWSKAATQLLRSWWSKAATQLLRSWWLWGGPQEPSHLWWEGGRTHGGPMGPPRGARGGVLHPLTKSREGSWGEMQPPPERGAAGYLFRGLLLGYSI